MTSTLPLSELAIDPRVEAELRWYFTEADGDMGLRSLFPAMVARLEVGGRTGGRPITEMDDRWLLAASRARRISRALELLAAADLRRADAPPPADRRVGDVQVLHCAFRAPEQDLPGWGSLTGVLPLSRRALSAWCSSHSTRTFEEWLFRLAWNVARRHGGKSNLPASTALLASIRLDASTMLRGAVQAYARARDLRNAQEASGRAARQEASRTLGGPESSLLSLPVHPGGGS
jgi:hypothetical protein